MKLKPNLCYLYTLWVVVKLSASWPVSESGSFPFHIPTGSNILIYCGGQHPSILLQFLRVLSYGFWSGLLLFFCWEGCWDRGKVVIVIFHDPLSQLCIFSHWYHFENNLSALCWPWEHGLWVSIWFLASAQIMNRVPPCSRAADLKKGLWCSWDPGHQHGFWTQHIPQTSAWHLVSQQILQQGWSARNGQASSGILGFCCYLASRHSWTQ